MVTVLFLQMVMWVVMIFIVCFAIGWAVTLVVVPVKWLVALVYRRDYHNANQE